MLDNSPLLTISIPTYNGDATIARLLDSIYKQTINTSSVEVLVSDNKSIDNTEMIVNKYETISYYCNDINLGADKNILLSIQKAKGKYVWVIGDDDYLADGAISYVLKILEKYNDIGAVFVNFSLYDTKKEKIYKYKWLDIDNDIYCNTSDEFLNATAVSSNFLSSMIHNKEHFITTNYEKYFGTNWVQFGTLFDYLTGKDSYCISTAYVVNAGESIEGEGNKDGKSIDILCNLMNIVSNLPVKYYSDVSIDKAKNNVRLFLIRKISSSKRLGLKLNYTLLRKIIKNFGDKVSFWLFAFPLLLLPSLFHKAVYKVYKLDFINSLYWKFKKV